MSVDPYVLVEDEIKSNLKAVEEELYDDKLESLIRSSFVTEALKKLQTSVESAEMQVNELSKAVEASAAMPHKFNLTQSQVQERRKQIEDFKQTALRYHDRITDLFEASRLSKRASQPTASPLPKKGVVSSYLNDETDREFESQQMLMKRQDEDLDDLSVAARRVGQMGLQIGDEIELQTAAIGELEEEVDTTKSRLKVANNMINKLGRRMGKYQWAVMGGLLLLLIILVAIVFS